LGRIIVSRYRFLNESDSKEKGLDYNPPGDEKIEIGIAVVVFVSESPLESISSAGR